MIYLIKPDRPFLKDQATENLNMNITLILWSIVSFVLTFVLIGVIGYIIVSIYFLVTAILAAVANSKGEIYRYPLILRLIK